LKINSNFYVAAGIDKAYSPEAGKPSCKGGDGFARDTSKADDISVLSNKLRDMKNKFSGKKGRAENLSAVMDRSLENIKKVKSLEMEGFMIPASEGKISHICLTYPLSGQGPTAQNFRSAFKTFLTHMDARFTVLTSSEKGREELQSVVDDMAKAGTLADPGRVRITDTGKHLSLWVQDSTLVVGNKVLEQEREQVPDEGDKEVPARLAGLNPELEYEKMEGIFIDGGNQLATEDRLFVGRDAIDFMVKDMKKYPSKYNKIENELGIEGAEKLSEEELSEMMIGRTFPHQKLVVIGEKGQQPAFHIDMAMTPLGKRDSETGKEVITIGDPYMAVEMLEEIKKKDPEKYREYEKNFINRVATCMENNPIDVMNNFIMEEIFLAGFKAKFDKVAEKLEGEGYKIERLPYLGSEALSNLPWITYNNCLIDGDNIFIPSYDIPELDGFAQEVYKKYGYNPVPVEMTAISSHRGAINCMTKVLEREYSFTSK